MCVPSHHLTWNYYCTHSNAVHIRIQYILSTHTFEYSTYSNTVFEYSTHIFECSSMYILYIRIQFIMFRYSIHTSTIIIIWTDTVVDQYCSTVLDSFMLKDAREYCVGMNTIYSEHSYHSEHVFMYGQILNHFGICFNFWTLWTYL